MLALLASLCAPSGAAFARSIVFSLAIGYNGSPANGENTPLRFADDDAASFHEFARTLSRRSFLLTVLDAESQRRFPNLAQEVRSPSLAELRRTVDELRIALDAAVAAREEPTVLIFYSGHGSGGGADQIGLTLLDGQLTRAVLYDEVIAPLHARLVHVFVDACHAEAVVRPRDRQAEVVSPTLPEIAAYLQRDTLARFPHVGAVVASTAGTQAHEWDGYGSGIFTHELLSALRGAADVDGNRRIEYSEIGAFLAAANRAVSDPRARPQTVIRAPPLDPRASVVDLADVRGGAFVQGRPAFLGAFSVEDNRGNRLLDMRADRNFNVVLALPAGETLYLRSRRGESVLRLSVGETLPFENLHMAETALRARGALDMALRRGLFATSFGPAYYRGFVDRAEDLVSVEIPDPDGIGLLATSRDEDPPTQPRTNARRVAYGALGASALLGVAAGVLGLIAWQSHRAFDQTDLEAPATAASDRYRLSATLSISALVASALTGGVASYMLIRDQSP